MKQTGGDMSGQLLPGACRLGLACRLGRPGSWRGSAAAAPVVPGRLAVPG